MPSEIGKEISDFISHFKGCEHTFLHGCCYWFAHILSDRFYTDYFPDVMYEPVEGHFVTRIDGRYYDIRGDVTEMYKDKHLYNLYDLNRDNHRYYTHLMRDCRDFKGIED